MKNGLTKHIRFKFSLWKGFAVLVICLCLGVLSQVTPLSAATPRVMVSDYTIKEGKVTAGKEFTLIVTLSNTSTKNTVKNLKLSLTSENGDLLPADGAGTAYVEQIDTDSETNLTFKMKARDGLEEKSYKLTLKTEYENTNGYEYTVEDSIFIPISLDQRLSVTDIFMAEDSVQIGDVVEISAVVNNLGAGQLYNVAAEVKGDNIQETSTYVGNIESGKSGTVDILTKADIVTEGDHKENFLIISYEDKEGKIYKQEIQFDVMVTKPIYENLEKVKEAADHSKTIKTVVTVIVVILVVAAFIYLSIKRRKRKQQILDEFIN